MSCELSKRSFIAGCAAVPLGAATSTAVQANVMPKGAYASIRRALVKPGSAPELGARVPEVVLPTLRSLPGFISFQMIYGDDDRVTAITVYESAAAARAANEKIIPIVRQVFGPVLAGPLEPAVGTVIASALR